MSNDAEFWPSLGKGIVHMGSGETYLISVGKKPKLAGQEEMDLWELAIIMEDTRDRVLVEAEAGEYPFTELRDRMDREFQTYLRESLCPRFEIEYSDDPTVMRQRLRQALLEI